MISLLFINGTPPTQLFRFPHAGLSIILQSHLGFYFHKFLESSVFCLIHAQSEREPNRQTERTEIRQVQSTTQTVSLTSSLRCSGSVNRCIQGRLSIIMISDTALLLGKPAQAFWIFESDHTSKLSASSYTSLMLSLQKQSVFTDS